MLAELDISNNKLADMSILPSSVIFEGMNDFKARKYRVQNASQIINMLGSKLSTLDPIVCLLSREFLLSGFFSAAKTIAIKRQKPNGRNVRKRSKYFTSHVIALSRDYLKKKETEQLL